MTITSFIVIVLVRFTYTEIYTAVTDLGTLLKTQERVIENLETYIRNEKQRIELLTMYLELYKTEHKMATDDRQKYLENPVYAFMIIKRLTTDLSIVEEVIAEKMVPIREAGMTFPTTADLQGAAQGLGRLQQTYNLNVTQVANGILEGNFSINKQAAEYFTPMTATDCYEVGRQLYSEGDYDKSLNWMTQALNKYLAGGFSYPLLKEDFVIIISYAYMALGDVDNTLKWTKKLPKRGLDPSVVKVLEDYNKRVARGEFNKEKVEKETKSNIDGTATATTSAKIEKSGVDAWITESYEALCRGEMNISTEISKGLKCGYFTGQSPFLKLAPMKMEQLYLKPHVLLFYDIISDREAEHIKSISKPQLERATVRQDGEMKVGKYRVSKTAWFADAADDVIARISRRTADFTGLNLETAEASQVTDYGIGGHYGPHYDYYCAKTEYDPIFFEHGNRLATVLIYMSDVAQGGATAFTELGLSVFPVRGAALYWRNLLPSGEGDEATMHGACPVLRGDKWVLNRWIHEHGNEFLSRCQLDDQESEPPQHPSPDPDDFIVVI